MLHRRLVLLTTLPLAYYVLNSMLVDDGVVTTLLAPTSVISAWLALVLVLLRLATIFIVPALVAATLVDWAVKTRTRPSSS